MGRDSRARWIAVLGAILLAAALSIAGWESRRFRESEYVEFQDRSVQVAEVFARSAEAWLAGGNEAALDGAIQLLLAGSGQYVRITAGEDVILEERNEGLRIPIPDTVPGVEESLSRRARAALRSGGIDILLPIELPSEMRRVAGSVQIGFADTFAAAQARSNRRFAFGLASGLWVVVMLLVVLSAAVLKRRGEEPRQAMTASTIRCGDLEIDAAACTVRVFGEEVGLTPKMFDLLAYLARHPGRTFSDQELIETLWADSPYAASGDVKQCVYMLRRRLGAVLSDPKRVVVNVKGFGYRLEPPTEGPLFPD